MNEPRDNKRLLAAGLESFRIDRPLLGASVLVTLFVIAVYQHLIGLRPWSWLARSGPNAAGIVASALIYMVVLCAAGYVLVSWIKERTASSTLTLGGLVLILFINYPVSQHGLLTFIVGPFHSVWRLIPPQWHPLDMYLHFGAIAFIALWANYLAYRLAKRHGLLAASGFALGLWAFYFGPAAHGPSWTQTALLALSLVPLAIIIRRPSSTAFKSLLGLMAASSVVGFVFGGFSDPVFTAFGLKRATLVPFHVFSTGVLGIVFAIALARRRSRSVQQPAAA